jgi:DNA-binding transcriptional MerR regulator
MPETARDAELPASITISQLAGEFGITPRAIRYYEECGLLSPQRKTPSSQRLYDERDRARLKLILRGKRFGYSLNEIGDVIKLYDLDTTQGKQIMRTLEYGFDHIREIDERIEDLRETREEMLEFARSFLEILKSTEGRDTREMKQYIAGAQEIIARLSEA